MNEENNYKQKQNLISNHVKDFKNKNCVYLINLEGDYYKFGLSTDIRSRMLTHYKHHNFKSIVRIWDCNNSHAEIEKLIKQYAIANNKLVRCRNETEVILSNEIDKEVANIDQIVAEFAFPIQHIGGLNVNGGNIVTDGQANQSDNKKCQSCNKMFRTPAELKRHKNKKNSCKVRTIREEDLLNPNRCIYCNKIFERKFNMERHVKICKHKNSKLDTTDKEVTLLKMQLDEMQRREKQRDLEIKKLNEQIQALKGATDIPQI